MPTNNKLSAQGESTTARADTSAMCPEMKRMVEFLRGIYLRALPLLEPHVKATHRYREIGTIVNEFRELRSDAEAVFRRDPLWPELRTLLEGIGRQVGQVRDVVELGAWDLDAEYVRDSLLAETNNALCKFCEELKVFCRVKPILVSPGVEGTPNGPQAVGQTGQEWLEKRAGASSRAREGSVQDTKRGRRGRRPLTPKKQQRYRDLSSRWEQARDAGVRKTRFCDDEGVSRAELEKALTWVRKNSCQVR